MRQLHARDCQQRHGPLPTLCACTGGLEGRVKRECEGSCLAGTELHKRLPLPGRNSSLNSTARRLCKQVGTPGGVLEGQW